MANVEKIETFNSRSRSKFPIPNTELYWRPFDDTWYFPRVWGDGFAMSPHKEPTVYFYLKAFNYRFEPIPKWDDGKTRRIYQLRKADGAWLAEKEIPAGVCNLGKGLENRLDLALIKSLFGLYNEKCGDEESRMDEITIMVEKLLQRFVFIASDFTTNLL